MKCFVIYDETGRIYAVEYGEKPSLPTKMEWLQEDIEDGAIPTSVDITDPEKLTLRYTVPEESKLKKEVTELRTENEKMSAQLAYLAMMSGFEMEVDHE